MKDDKFTAAVLLGKLYMYCSEEREKINPTRLSKEQREKNWQRMQEEVMNKK